MKFQLVLQWPSSAFASFDALIALEELIIKVIGGESVDGHDLGSGEANIFLLTDSPKETFDTLRFTALRGGPMTAIKAAFRETDGDEFTIVWPPGERHFSIQ